MQAESVAKEAEVMRRVGKWLGERAPESLAGSRNLLAAAERRAAKGLWSASSYLSRAANRLDAAGLALSLRASESPKASVGTTNQPGAESNDFVDDEICTPHLA